MTFWRDLAGVLCIVLLAAIVACGVPGVPKPPSLQLPQPVSDLRAMRKGDKVYLAWTVPTQTTDQENIRQLGATRICRSSNVLNDCSDPAEQAGVLLPLVRTNQGKAANPVKIQATYTDELPWTMLRADTNAKISYAVSVQNTNERSAGLSNIVSLPAVPALPPPADFAAQVTSEGVVLTWSEVPHDRELSGGRRLYRVYRRDESGADAVAGELPVGTLRSYVLFDHGFDWEKTYFYRATVSTMIQGKSADQFEGDDSPAIKVLAHDVFPPAVPTGVQAAVSAAGQPTFIDLIWAPDTDADLAGYNVFRREAGTEAVKINASLVTAPAFRDMGMPSGHTYFYSVSAVDVRNNESKRSEEASEAVP